MKITTITIEWAERHEVYDVDGDIVFQAGVAMAAELAEDDDPEQVSQHLFSRAKNMIAGQYAEYIEAHSDPHEGQSRLRPREEEESISGWPRRIN